MVFYELSAPDYDTDAGFAKHNSVKISSRYFIPSMRCNVCGVWSSSNRLRKAIQTDKIEQFKGIRILDLQEWLASRGRWASDLGVEEKSITPGAELGTPTVEVLSTDLEDVMHPLPGEIIITGRVLELVTEHDLKGVEYIRLERRWGKGTGGAGDPPELWEPD